MFDGVCCDILGFSNEELSLELTLSRSNLDSFLKVITDLTALELEEKESECSWKTLMDGCAGRLESANLLVGLFGLLALLSFWSDDSLKDPMKCPERLSLNCDFWLIFSVEDRLGEISSCVSRPGLFLAAMRGSSEFLMKESLLSIFEKVLVL